jgi:hypothetical protein
LRLDVAVQYTARVSGCQAIGDTREQFYHLPPGPSLGATPVFQRTAIDEFRD